MIKIKFPAPECQITTSFSLFPLEIQVLNLKIKKKPKTTIYSNKILQFQRSLYFKNIFLSVV